MQKFTLDHIKSFMHSEEIEIKPITVLVGKNSCGKSSLLRFPAVLAQTFREEALTPLLLFGSLIDYGNYEDVAYRHGDSPIGFRLAFGPELMDAARARYHTFSDTHDMGLAKVKSIEVQVHICKPEKRLQVQD